MAKSLTWTNNGLASEDGRFVIGVVHGLDGQPSEFYWERCPLLKLDKPTEDTETYAEQGVAVLHHEVLSDDRPHGAETLEEMHEQAAVMTRSRDALKKFEEVRKVSRKAATAKRRQDAEDAKFDELVAKLMSHPKFAERFGGDR